MTVAKDQPVTILIDLLDTGIATGRHLRQQGDREHLPRGLAHDLIEHRTFAVSGSASSWTTLSMLALPGRRANAGT
jgi:hypothetical protein